MCQRDGGVKDHCKASKLNESENIRTFDKNGGLVKSETVNGVYSLLALISVAFERQAGAFQVRKS